jgi:dolichol kinase
MHFVFFALIIVSFLLLVSEVLWRKRIISGEFGRKFVHMSMGVFIAIWPFFMPLEIIQLIGCAAIVVLFLSRKFNVFHAIHDVTRTSYGDILYPLSIVLISLLAQTDWIFSLAVLFLAVPDGMAAIAGKKLGNKHGDIKVWNNKKTIVGTCTYILFAYIVIGIGLLIGGKNILVSNAGIVVFLPLVAAILEVISPYGLDNFTVPLVVVLTLNALTA